MKWQYNTTAPIDSLVVVWGSNIFFGNDNGDLYCLTDNGASASLCSGWGTNPVNLGACAIKTTPVLTDKDSAKHLIVSCGSTVHLRQVANGLQATGWPAGGVNVNGEIITAGAVVGQVGTVDNNYIYVLTQDAGTATNQVYKLNKADGTVAATFPLDVAGVKASGSYRYCGGNSPPSRLLFGAQNNTFYVIDADSFANPTTDPYSQTWTYTGATGVYNYAAWVNFCADRIYISNADGNIRKLNVDGTVAWTQNIGADCATPVAIGSNVYVGCANGNIYVLDEATGAIKASWPYASGDAITALPAFRFISGALRAVFPSTSGRIFAFDF